MVCPPESEYSISYLKSLCDGKSSAAITQDITVYGFVTANDLYGEYDRMIVVEDGSDGIAIAIDHTPLADLFPFGYLATVRCNGLTLYDYGGKILLGTAPGDDSIGRIPRDELARYIHADPPAGEARPVERLTFDAVSARHIDTRVCFEGVHFAEAGSWCDTDPETHRTVTTERRSPTHRAEPSPCGPPEPVPTQKSPYRRVQAPCMELSTISPENTRCASPTAKHFSLPLQRLPQHIFELLNIQPRHR